MQRRESMPCGSNFLDGLETPFVGRGLFYDRFAMMPKRVRFEDDPIPPEPPPTDPPPTDPPPPPKPPASDKKFSQADLDRVVANQRRELTQKHLDEVNRLKKSAGLTAEEKANLEERSKELEDALLTEKEQAKKEVERVKKQLAEERDKAKKEANHNWSLFVDSKISTEIATAAAKHKAFNPSQVEAIVRPLCVVEDEKDDKLEKTGKHLVRVHTTKKGENGTTEKVTLTVDEFVASMGESDEFYNLFLSDRPGGMGARPGKKGGGADPKSLTPKQKIAEGLRGKK